MSNSCPGTGGKMLNSDWQIKTHKPGSKILESRQMNTPTFEPFDSTLEATKRDVLSLESLAKLLSKNR